jgi:hypothetical protein
LKKNRLFWAGFLLLTQLLPACSGVKHAPMRTGVQPVSVSAGNGDFRPVIMKVAASSDDAAIIQLTHEQPSYISRVPRFTGGEVLFGYLSLGIRKNRLFPLALEVWDDGSTLLYLDQNQNGDLTDEPEPVPGRNPGLFSGEIAIPSERLSENALFPDSFRIWVFTNSSLWPRRQLRHYSRTQLKGSIKLGESSYDAYLVDTGGNDANLGNDGICIDLDRSQTVTATECLKEGESFSIGREQYTVRIVQE